MIVPQEVVAGFLPEITDYRAEALGSGLIHQTYSVHSDQGTHVFQKLNAEVFPDCAQMMQNILQVTDCLHSQGEPTLSFMKNVTDGSLLVLDGEEHPWRCCRYIPQAVTYDTPPSPEHLVNAARAFARFGLALTRCKDLALYPIIADFHHTPKRFEAMKSAWSKASDERRDSHLYEELCGLENAFPEFGLNGLSPNEVPYSVSHNDTKLNNCLFRDDSHQVLCVIDLDTVMEGSWLMDFGDLCRTAICEAPEDTRDLASIEVDLDRFRALAEGYAEVLADSVTHAEQVRMVYSVFLLTYELALRFFTDHLNGDRYFSASYPGHNLVRARAQLELASKVVAARATLEQIVNQALTPD